jgi:putative membrane protein
MEIYHSETKQKQLLERQKYRPERIGIILLIAFHFFGLLGMNWSWLENTISNLSPFSSFASLTPFNLLLTCGILLYFHKDWNRSFIFFTIICFLIGFFVEIAGVHTGIIFGEYSYGVTLGWKIADVPLTIGINWLILVYSTGIVLSKIQFANWQKALLLALLMTLIDFLIEPVAIRLDFWSWTETIIPVQNYIAWFVVSFLLGYLFFRLEFEKLNPIAKWVLICQILFFFGHNMLM